MIKNDFLVYYDSNKKSITPVDSVSQKIERIFEEDGNPRY